MPFDQQLLDNFEGQVTFLFGIVLILSVAAGTYVMRATNAIKAAIPPERMRQGTPLVIAFGVSAYIVLCVLVAVFVSWWGIQLVAIGALAILLIGTEAAVTHEVFTAQRLRRQERIPTGAKVYPTSRHTEALSRKE